MDCQSKNIFEITKECSKLTKNAVQQFDIDLKEQIRKIDLIYNSLLQNAIKSLPSNETNEKESKRNPKSKNKETEDFFAAGPSFQQSEIISPNRTTKIQASIVAINTTKDVGKSMIISSGVNTRGNRARLISSFTEINPSDLPKANSTLVYDEQFTKNKKKRLSPVRETFTPENEAGCAQESHNESIKSTPKNTLKIIRQNVNLTPKEPSIKENKFNFTTRQFIGKIEPSKNGKFDDKHLKAVKYRRDHIKQFEKKIKKIAEEKLNKEKIQKTNELVMRVEKLKRKQTVLQVATEIDAKREQAEEKILRTQNNEKYCKTNRNVNKKKREIIPKIFNYVRP